MGREIASAARSVLVKDKHGIGRPADEQTRHRDLRAVEFGGGLPVAVEIAIPVQAAGETGAGELGDVVVELVLAYPVRQPVGFGQPLDETFRTGGHHPQRRGLVIGGPQAAAIMRRIARAGSAFNSASATPGSWKYRM